MADLQSLLEAERRGILPEGQKALLDEARRRGLIQDAPQADLRAGVMTGQIQPAETGAPGRVRALVGAVSDPADRLATLRQFFPNSVQDPVTGRLVFQNPETGEVAFVNPESLDVGDIPSLAREGVQAIGGTLGAIAGAAGGIPGATVGASVGVMVGEEVFNFFARLAGTVDNRTLGERAKETGLLGLFEGGGQLGGSAIGAAFRGGARTGGRAGRASSEIQQAIDDLARFDASPSLAQATQSQLLDGLESLVSRAPGGAGQFRKVVKETTESVAQSLEGRVARLTGRTAVDPEFAGRTVQKGLSEGFVGRFNDTAEELFNRIGVDPAQEVSIANTAEAIAGLNLLPEVPAVNALVTSPTVRALAGGAATGGGSNVAPGLPATLSYEVLKRMRSAVGRRISNPSIVTDVPTADLRQIYAAISRDMEAAAAAAGPAASRAFSRANRFYRSGLGRIEDVLDKLANKATPEQIFRSIESGAKQGPTQVRTVMRSLTTEERKVLAGGLIRRIGRALPSQQGAEGAEFSFETFLTNWNRLDDSAKSAMFGWPELRGMKADLDALARASERMRETSRAFFNPSGTAGAMTGQTALFLGSGLGIAGAVTGSTGLLVTPAILAVGILGNNMAARLMTNRRFVRWLAQSTRIKPNGVGAHIGRLAGVAAASEDKEPIIRYLDLFNSTEPASQDPDR